MRKQIIFLLLTLVLVGCDKGGTSSSDAHLTHDLEYTGTSIFASDLPALKSEAESKQLKHVTINTGWDSLDSYRITLDEVKTVDFGVNWAYITSEISGNDNTEVEETYMLHEHNYTFMIHAEQSKPDKHDHYLYDENREVYDGFLSSYTRYGWAISLYDLLKTFKNEASLTSYTEYELAVPVTFTKKDNFYQITRYYKYDANNESYNGERLEIVDGYITKYESYDFAYNKNKLFREFYKKVNFEYGETNVTYKGPAARRLPLDFGLERQVVDGAALPHIERSINWGEVIKADLIKLNSQGSNHQENSEIKFYENGLTRHDLRTLSWDSEPDYLHGLYHEENNTYYVGRGNRHIDEMYSDNDQSTYADIESDILGNYGGFVKKLPDLINAFANFRFESTQRYIFDFHRENVTLYQAGDYFCLEEKDGDKYEEYWFKIEGGIPTFFEHAYKRVIPNSALPFKLTSVQRETFFFTYGEEKVAYDGPRYNEGK